MLCCSNNSARIVTAPTEMQPLSHLNETPRSGIFAHNGNEHTLRNAGIKFAIAAISLAGSAIAGGVTALIVYNVNPIDNDNKSKAALLSGALATGIFGLVPVGYSTGRGLQHLYHWIRS